MSGAGRKSLDLIGDIYQAQRKLAIARDHYQRAIAVWRKANGPAHPTVAGGLLNLARNDLSTGRLADAEAHAREAMAIHEKVFGKASPKLAADLALLDEILARCR